MSKLFNFFRSFGKSQNVITLPSASFEDNKFNIARDSKKDIPVNKANNLYFKEKKNIFLTNKVAKNLVIFLIEDTDKMYEIKDELNAVIQSVIGDRLFCIIRYGQDVEIMDILDCKKFDESMSCISNTNQKKCFFDAIRTLSKVVIQSRYRVIKNAFEEWTIDSIDVVGFGTCQDNVSNGQVCEIQGVFSTNVMKIGQARTKYITLKKENIVNAAEIGFRSIGSFEQKL